MDLGLGAPLARPGDNARRTCLFRAVLSHTRKGYSEVVLRHDTETFLRAIKARCGILLECRRGSIATAPRRRWSKRIGATRR